MWWGALGWVVFSVIAVALRGVRWEETYEHALIITGAVPYPESHPCFQYCRNVFSGQSYLSALLIHFFDAPLLINGYRNVLQLAFCTVPVFLLGARLSGKARYGHVAVVLVLVGIHRGLQSYYPIESWPHMYAIGQIGTGYALFVLALLLYDCWRTVWLLLGLMVAIHIGQLPVIGAVAGVQWLIYLYRGDRQRVLQALGYFAVGLVPCVILYVAMTSLHVPLPTEGAYAATGDNQAIWAAYTERYDLHRGFARLNPFWKSWIGVAFVLLLAGLNGWRERRDGAMDHRWVLLYGTILAAVVGSIWLVHQAMEGDIPFLLLGWMPYRLTNHLAIVLVPLALGILAHTPADRDRPYYSFRVYLLGVVIWVALDPFFRLSLPDTIYTRYAGNPDTALWLLAGGGIGAAIARLRHHASPVWIPVLASIVGLAVLAWLSPYAAAVTLAGLVACGLLWWAEKFCECGGPIDGYLTLATFSVLLTAIVPQTAHREHLPIHPLQQEVVDYLAAQGEEDAMLVVPYWDVAWLAKTRHPIFADYQAAHHMTYMRSLAPSLKKMHAEVYGFAVDGDHDGPPLATWPQRSAAEWHALADAYELDYLLAPAEMTIQLEPVLPGQPYTLYRVRP